jgi:hypothetical protein
VIAGDSDRAGVLAGRFVCGTTGFLRVERCSHMPSFLFICPRTGVYAQGWTDAHGPENDSTYETVTCNAWPTIRVAREQTDVAMVHSRIFQTFNCRLGIGVAVIALSCSA